MISILKPLALICTLALLGPALQAQTKRLKRPSSRVGIYSVDTFVQESFDIYDKVYRYDKYVKNGTALEDEDIDLLEGVLTDATRLLEHAPNVLSDLDGQGALKQTKATLQINRAKKALKYSVKMAKELLAREKDSKGDDDTAGNDTNGNGSGSSNGSSGNSGGTSSGSSNGGSGVSISTKFDFVPGDKQLFYDDFSADRQGDFPSQWNTNGSGEIVKLSGHEENWFEIKPGYGTVYLPDVANLPEEFTIELDVMSSGLDKQTSSAAVFRIRVDENNGFKEGRSFAQVQIPYAQYVDPGFRVLNRNRSKTEINNEIKIGVRNSVIRRHHISIAVNKQRFRLWIDQKKCVDVPRLVPKGQTMNAIKFQTVGFNEEKERIFITNVKVAEGGQDLRGKLLAEGKISTNGILFDSGSSVIKPQSYGILKQISQALKQESAMRLHIIGHTDSDGSDKSNLKLSKSRAEAVRQALISTYGISGDRLTSEGKGEAEPVADNSSAEGKSQNRRVEFVKQ